MAGSVTVTLSGLQDLTGLSEGNLSDADQIRNLENLLRAIQNGATPAASMAISTGVADAVRASGTLTMASSSGTVGGTIGGTAVTVTWATSDTASSTALAAAINANTTVNKYVSATSSGAVTTITAHTPGEGGNGITLAASGTNVTASAAKLAGGTGPNGAPTTFSF